MIVLQVLIGIVVIGASAAAVVWIFG